ncbi:MAG: MBG domain-containing protein [Verrucomicrobiota bacterium]|nr:MBG domain-containing protein [Verrucomicrobiota bacterium]
MCFRSFSLPLLVSLVVLSFATAALAAPTAPTYLAARAETSTSVVLLWNDNSADETGFEIQYTTDLATNPPPWVSFGTVVANQTGVQLTTPANFAAKYQVRAVNGSGNSAFTPIVTCTQAAFNAPGSLNRLVNQESTLITWADNATTETGFEIETRKLPAGAFSLLGSVGANVVVVDLLGSLEPNSSYEVRIRARTGASAPYTYSGYSNTTSLTTQFNAPTSLTATTASEGTVNLSWSDNSAIEQGYAIYFKPTSSGSYTLFNYSAANASSFSVTGLAAGTAYDFQVAAAFQSSPTNILESARSNTTSATTRDGFTSGTAPPIFHNQPFSYQAVVTTGSARTSWSITGLPTGLDFNSSTGAITGTATVTGAFNCPMSATFANGWTTNNTLQLRVIRAAAAPVSATTVGTQTLAAGGNTSVSLTDKFSDPDSESAVRIVTNLGTMDFILYNTATPQTVTNFLSYVNAAVNNYNGAVFHRAIPGFVVQGGGFKVQSAPNNFSAIPTAASPINEPGISNLRGTVAMAKIGSNPNSATNQFFVNLGNNSSNLDRDSGSPNANGGFTAFARVAGSGMTVADAMAGLPTVNSSVNVNGTPNSSLTDWPLTSASASMDTTKVVSISSAAPVAVLSYAVTGNTNSAVASAVISGTNVQINALSGGQTDVTVRATDLDGNTVTQTFTVTVNQTPVFTNGPPPSTAVVGTAYNFAYTASGFPAPTFSHTGTLPPGLSLSSTGVISGTPTTAGTYSGIVVTASNGIGVAPTQTISITVDQIPSITSAAPAAGIVGTAYTHTYAATGSPAPTYSLTAGALPGGLSVSTAGVISGTPNTAGTFTGTITSTNRAGSFPQAFSITINQAPTFTSSTPTNSGTFNTAYNFTCTASGFPAPSFSVAAGALPTGLSLSTSGVISGTPTAAGTYTGTLSASNGIGSAASQSFSITIQKAAATVALGSLAPTYTGSPLAATSTTNPANLSVSYTYNGLSTMPTNAGSYAVVASINEPNYVGTANGTLVIAKATATVSLGSLAQTYNGSAKAATATTSPTGLTVNLTYDGSATAPTNVATYAVVGTINDTNYAGSAAGTLVIAKATATITLNGLTQAYDGSAKSVSATTSPLGLMVNVTYNGSASAPTSHGSHAVQAVIDDSNYNGSASGTLLIQGQSMSHWRTQHFSPEQITAGLADDDADPDGDGWKNLAEYALGMNPMSRNPALLPVRDANGLTLNFTRPKDMPDVIDGAQSTDDLAIWNAQTLEVISDGPVQTMRVRDPLTSGNPSRRIMRLIFDRPAPIE